MGLLYQVDDNCPLLWMIFMSRNGMDPFSSLSMVNFRDGCKLLIVASFSSISICLMFRMMSSMYLAYNTASPFMVLSNWLIQPLAR